jgi:hypothetical protein
MAIEPGENHTKTVAESEPASAGEHPKARGGLWTAILFRLIVLAISATLALVLSEVILTVIGYRRATPDYGHPQLGFDTFRNQTSTFVFPEYGGPLTMKTNNLGFHEDTDTQHEKAPGAIRVIVVGDSHTAGECANAENYPNVWEGLVNQDAKRPRVEVINAGVGRFSPYQYYVKTETQLTALKPDVLVVGLYIGNDFMDLMRRDDRPYLVRNRDGSITPHAPEFTMFDDPGKKPTFLSRTRVLAITRDKLGHSVLYQLQRARMLWNGVVEYDRGPLDISRYMIDVKRLTDLSLGFMTQSMLQDVWFRHFPETLNTAYEFNRYVMREFQALCARNGIKLIYAMIPAKVQIEPDDMEGIVKQFMAYDPSFTSANLAAFADKLSDQSMRDAQALGITAIDLRQPMRERRNGVRLYYPSEMHLSPAGNRVIATILRDSIRLEPPAK